MAVNMIVLTTSIYLAAFLPVSSNSFWWNMQNYSDIIMQAILWLAELCILILIIYEARCLTVDVGFPFDVDSF